MDQGPFPCPEPAPHDETVLPEDDAFTKECLSAIARDVEEIGIVIGQPLLTYSKEFGFVWRADFGTRRGGFETMGLTNRVMCWRLPDVEGVYVSFTFGQKLPKLR